MASQCLQDSSVAATPGHCVPTLGKANGPKEKKEESTCFYWVFDEGLF